MNEDYRNYQEQLESIKDNNESHTFLTSNNISHHDINQSHNRVDIGSGNGINKQYKNVINHNNNSYLDKMGNLSNIEDVKSSANNTINKNSSIMQNPYSRPESRGDGRPESAQHLAINRNKNTNKNYFSNTLFMSKSNDSNNKLYNIDKNKDNQIKLQNPDFNNQDQIKESKPKKKLVEDQIKLKDKLKKIELENKKIKSMRNLKTIENQEEIFLKCINDVKHELLKNPQMKLSKSNI